jgi:hypothetical protein
MLSTVAAVGSKPRHAVELKARQLQHPDLGQRGRVEMARQRVEQRGADIAGHGHRLARALDQLARERRDRGLAIGAGDGQHRLAHSRAQRAASAQGPWNTAQFASSAYSHCASSYENRSN